MNSREQIDRPMLYLDMDDTLVDFWSMRSVWEPLSKKLDYENMQPHEVQASINVLKDSEKVEWMFASMPWIAGGQELIAWINSHQIPWAILSRPLEGVGYKASIRGKKKWLATHGLGSQPAFFRRSKEVFAITEQANVLIDDSPDNIRRWNEGGGIGIIYDHQNLQRTLFALSKIYKVDAEPITEHVVKLANGKYQLRSIKKNSKGKTRNLGTFDSRAAAEKHEREVEYFKHKKSPALRRQAHLSEELDLPIKVMQGSEATIVKVSQQDLPELMEVGRTCFPQFSDIYDNVVNAETGGDFSYSYVAKMDGRIVGGYILVPMSVYSPDISETYPYKNLRGIQGVSLFVATEFRGTGIGKRLRDLPLRWGFDYVWGEQFIKLGNLNNWTAFGRRLLFTQGGVNVTIMDLSPAAKSAALKITGNLYHVTHTRLAEKIRREGLRLLRTSNWIVAANGNRYGQGEVNAFESFKDAVRWAGKMDWEFNRKLGSGKVSIVTLSAGNNLWTVDSESDPIGQASSEGRWLKTSTPVPTENILEITPFTQQFAQKLIAGDHAD